MHFRRIFVAAALILLAASGCSKQQVQTADLAVVNGKVVTIDSDNPRAEAVAVKGEEVIAVGSSEEIGRYIEDGETEVIDAGGRLVIPGFNDAHIHFGPIDPDYIDLRYITDPGVITGRVREKVSGVEPGVLIRGGRWDHEMFPDKKWPDRELIDPVSPDNPVVLGRVDGHSVLVNSYVLDISGIDRDTPDPAGGKIQRNPVTGEPTGILKEAAEELIKLPGDADKPGGENDKRRKWQAAFEMAARTGVTSIQLPEDADFAVYQEFMDSGELTLRVDVSKRLTYSLGKLIEYNKLKKEYPPDGNWIRFGILKDFMDGTLGSATAMMFEPFEGEVGNTGLPQMEYEELERRVLRADSLGFQIGIHAIGTRGNHWVLNAYEKARQVNGIRDSRHRAEHAQLLTEDDILRFAGLGVIASMQPTHCITDKRFCEKRIGQKRSRWAYAWQSLLDAGADIAFGTDYPVEPIDPLQGIYAAVTRKARAGEEGEGWFPEQKLSMEKAIELYTLGSAYAQFMEDRKGMIREGYLADMVIYDRDLMSIPHDQIMSARVDYTIVGGRVVYRRD
ncbi:MAG: amidohydrolase family protein [Candidatus Latescibacteria bacterium]|nr:amidohydrolase family protein [bacterium]MBD3424722.1 amidohydrolase family protein [Candidatus Latescibacterota bacterium]